MWNVHYILVVSILPGTGDESLRVEFMGDKRTDSHEVERDDHNFGDIENAVVSNHNSGQTHARRTFRRAVVNYRHAYNICHLSEKNGFAVDQKPSEDDQEEFDTECKSDTETQEQTRRVVLNKEVDSVEGVDSCVLDESEQQNCRSYLYEKNPLIDPRFTRLIERLVPLRSGIQAERKKFPPATKKNLSDKSDEICFKDICLNDTCRLVFKMMNGERRF